MSTSDGLGMKFNSKGMKVFGYSISCVWLLLGVASVFDTIPVRDRLLIAAVYSAFGLCSLLEFARSGVFISADAVVVKEPFGRRKRLLRAYVDRFVVTRSEQLLPWRQVAVSGSFGQVPCRALSGIRSSSESRLALLCESMNKALAEASST